MSDNDSPSTTDVEKLRTANAFHSKTRSLPNETLSYIFQLACPALDIFDECRVYSNSKFHLVLRLVSTLWYSVVQSTPQLWNSLWLSDITREENKEYIKHCLENSGQLGLNIRFRSLSHPPHPTANEDWANEIMERNIHRIKSLQVFSPTQAWFKTMVPNMSQLSAINVYETPGLPNVPSLKRMRLESAKLGGIYNQSLMTSITHLDLQRVPIDCSIQLLVRCPNLVEFSCLDHSSPTPSAVSVLTSTLVLGQLSAFFWSTPNSRYYRTHNHLFQHLHVPALQRFLLDNHQKLKLEKPTFAFLSRLPKSMKELEFRYINHGVPKGLLGDVVNDTGIGRIRMEHCSPLFLEDLFSILSETTDEGIFRFPNLACIQVGHLGKLSPDLRRDPPLNLWIGQQLVQMLQDRAGTIDRFTFISEDNPLTDWNDEIWGFFKDLKEGGLDLTIIDSGKVVDVEARYAGCVEG